MRALAVLLALLVSACATLPPRPVPMPVVAPAPEEPAVLGLPRPEGGEWLGLYLMGKKAGWLFGDLVTDTFGGVAAVRSEMRLRLEVAVGGKVAVRTAIERRWYERKPAGRLLGFEAIRTGDGGDRHTSATCDAGACAVRIRDEAGERIRTIPLPPETVDDADPVRLAVAGEHTLQTAWLDLDELEVRRAAHRFAGREGGVVRIATIDEGESLEQYTLIDASGATLEVQIGAAVTGRAEPEASARAAGEPADVFVLTRVPLPGPLPEAPDRLVLEVEGLPEHLQAGDHRQRFDRLADGAVRITIDVHAAPPPPPGDLFPLYKSFLRTSPSIDWDTPAIRALADELRQEAGPEHRAVAAALVQHVAESLEKSYGASSDTATRVLAQGKGDCTEHTLLFVALARASGIPARQVHGLVHADAGPGPALYWHEWAEVWLDGAWLAVDPTFGQMPADATHLRLGQGRTASSTGAMGQLRIRRATAYSR